MAKNRVFAIHQFNDFSGSPKVLSDALTAINNKEVPVTLFTSQHKGFLSNLSCSKVILPYFRFNNKFLVLLFYSINQLMLFFLLGYHLIIAKRNGETPKVLVNTIMPFSAILVSRLLSIPVYNYIHEVSVKPFILFRFLRLISTRFSVHIICVSEFMVNELGISDYNNVTVIPNSVGLDWLDKNIIYTVESKFDAPQALMVGSLKKFKGVDSYIKLAKENPNIQFKIALNCSEGEFLEFEAKYRSSNFLPYLRPKNIKNLYASSLFIFNLSKPELCVETFGLTLIEGMSYGCVPIGPQVGGPAEIIDCSVGLKADYRDLHTICDFIKHLSEQSNNFQSYYSNCLKRSENYSFENYSIRLCKVIGIK
ncbi:hypothetical protein BCT45_05315 [Vibrio breoganii]|uniref:glycosyltransferase family 4 protein n=1 Tax=Vibrio breoganii TaxID=553239 RepID=UPI000C83CBD9|nr:glycosyltransferase family 4 protein [Vibrio breoganii]PMM86853.1 hypothetical protein BCT45_05315 [Vibrio breoganii]